MAKRTKLNWENIENAILEIEKDGHKATVPQVAKRLDASQRGTRERMKELCDDGYLERYLIGNTYLYSLKK